MLRSLTPKPSSAGFARIPLAERLNLAPRSSENNGLLTLEIAFAP